MRISDGRGPVHLGGNFNVRHRRSESETSFRRRRVLFRTDGAAKELVLHDLTLEGKAEVEAGFLLR